MSVSKHSVWSLPSWVQDMLDDASDRRVSPRTPVTAFLSARECRPGVVRADGTLTRHGRRCRDELHDHQHRQSGYVPRWGEGIPARTPQAGGR
ncbi:hypothetical protein [Tomitella cavernea]|uniref:Uncharacterized protein n=1 Tax=Tomitella cavernea TaxID=1387982 RepID=A0ABP9CEE0_9ACTN|nr:hypothetical protein [Tomitella cavernea]